MFKVTSAALRHAGPPERVFSGPSHAEAISAALKAHVHPRDCAAGFLLSDGSFAHRVAAMEAALESGQVLQSYLDAEVLFSYMLKEGWYDKCPKEPSSP